MPLANHPVANHSVEEETSLSHHDISSPGTKTIGNDVAEKDSTIMKCPSCGADLAPMEMQCGHCGSHLPLAASPSQAAIFARIKASESYDQRNSPERIAQLPKVGELQKVFLHVFFVIFICGSGFMAVMMLGMAGVFGLFGIRSAGGLGAAFSLAPLCMAGVPVGFVILGVFILRHQRKKMHSLENDPVDATPVVIVDKRTQVTGGGNSSARTSYFVTCETEEGGRQEYQVWDGNLYGRLAADDAGILFVRAGYGLDFDRVIP